MDEPLQELLRLRRARRRLGVSPLSKPSSPSMGAARSPRDAQPPPPLYASQLRRAASLAKLSEEAREAQIERLQASLEKVYKRIALLERK